MTWKYETASLPGDRENQQDSHAVLDSSHGKFYILADGLGGQCGGAEASNTAIESIAHFLGEISDDADLLKRLGQSANETVRNLRKLPGLGKAACTLAILWLNEQHDSATLATIGDTRIYHLSADHILHTSRDHTVAQLLLERGDITLAELPTHPDRNRLTRALGSEEFPGFEITHFPLHECAGFLLATDGFWEKSNDQEIISLIINGGVRAAASLAVARATPDADNTTATLVTQELASRIQPR